MKHVIPPTEPEPVTDEMSRAFIEKVRTKPVQKKKIPVQDENAYSKCCHAPARTYNGREGTSFYYCGRCQSACDIDVAKTWTTGAVASTTRTCPKDCKGDDKHLHVEHVNTDAIKVLEKLKIASDKTLDKQAFDAMKYAFSTTVNYTNNPNVNKSKHIPWFRWLRRGLLVICGMLLILAFQKWQYDAIHQAIYDALFLKR